VGNKALQQTIKNIVIEPGSMEQKALEFRWPEK